MPMSEERKQKMREMITEFNNSMTPEERSEFCRKAAIRSGQVRRRNRTLKIIAKHVVDMKISKREKRQLAEFGIKPDDVGDCKKGAGFFICLENAIIKGDIQGYAKMMEIAGEYVPNSTLTVPTDSERKVVTVIMPGAVPPPPPPAVPAIFEKGDSPDENSDQEPNKPE